MMKMTREEREAWRVARHSPWCQVADGNTPVDVHTPQARLRYIHFATATAAFCRAPKPVRFHGKHWKL